MSTRVNNTKVIISARASYLHAFEPDSINGSDPKYSVSLIIDKKDTDLIFEHTIVANGTSSVHYLPDILESAGTMRYYGLGTILNILLERNAIIPVDELENSLHLFAHFINLFLVNSTYSQLIFSTHNLQSLDTEDLRKDVVWFTEKKDDGSTDLFSLDDFNIRNGVSFLNAYNAGKFGAKPTLGGIFIPKKR